MDRFREEINRRFIDENYSSKFIDRDIIGEIEVRSIGFFLIWDTLEILDPFWWKGAFGENPKFIWFKGVHLFWAKSQFHTGKKLVRLPKSCIESDWGFS